MVAGEASGDLLAGMLLAGLRARWPALKADGIGGPKMAAQGFESWWPHDKLAVRGYVEVLSHSARFPESGRRWRPGFWRPRRMPSSGSMRPISTSISRRA